MGQSGKGNKAPEAAAEQGVDMTDIMAAAAKLKGLKPPVGRVIMPATAFPNSEKVRRDEEAASAAAVALAAAAAKKLANMKVGDELEDGSVYAGLTPDGKQRIYAMPVDLDVTMTFNDAAKRVAGLNASEALGHDDWQIPDLEILRVMQKSQNEGELSGTFRTASGAQAGYPLWYWSSTENRDDPSKVGIVRFENGEEHSALKDEDRLSCRPVRLVPLSS